MGRTLVPRYLAALDLSSMSDTQLHAVAGDVALAAKTSTLVLGNAQMQANVASLATKDTTLTTANKAVADDRATLRVDISAEALARSDVLGELRTYGNYVGSYAKSPADVKAAGLPPLAPKPPKNAPPTVPESLYTKTPKKGHGKATVGVNETGPTQHHFVAQESLDGLTWTQLGVGFGKTRVVTGASGTKIWVRFAMVRSQLQSDWCTPVLVTIP